MRARCQRERQRPPEGLFPQRHRLQGRSGRGTGGGGVCFEHEAPKAARLQDPIRNLGWCVWGLNSGGGLLTTMSNRLLLISDRAPRSTASIRTLKISSFAAPSARFFVSGEHQALPVASQTEGTP